MQETQIQGPEVPMEELSHGSDCTCEMCTTQLKENEYEESSLAVLLALIPLLVFTFMGQAGLF